jgi:hypothetical protein
MKKLSLALLVMFLFSQIAFAQEKNQFSLGVYPSLLEITAEPPSNINTGVTIENKSQNKINLNIVFRPFKAATSNDGQIEFLPDNTSTGADASIFQKIKVYDGEAEVKKITLAPLESRSLSLRINLDQATEPSDYYFSLLFVSDQTENKISSTQAIGGIGTNVLLSVGNRQKAAGYIAEFDAPFLITGNSTPFTLAVQNSTGQLINPSAQILIYDMFGRKAGELTLPPQYILANTKRYLKNQEVNDEQAKIKSQEESPLVLWKRSFLFGVYKADASVTLSDGQKPLRSSIIFVALPIYLIFALSFFSFIAISVYIRVKKKIGR